MLERDRTDEDVQTARRAREAARVPAPQIARVLALQRSLGNQHVAGLLQRRLLSRDVAVPTTITWGPQRHHPSYKFTFPEQEEHGQDFDHWFSNKTQAPLEHAGTIPQERVKQLVDAWDGTGSIIARIAAALVGTLAMPDPDLDKIGKNDGYGVSGQVNVKDELAGTAAGRLFAEHFLMLQSNIALREADMGRNAVTKLTVLTEKSFADKAPKKKGTVKTPVAKPKPVPYELDWGALLTAARVKLAEELKAENPAPAKDKVTLAHDAYKVAPGNFETLRALKILMPNGKLNMESTTGVGPTKHDHKVTAQEPDGLDYKFGLNHLRTIIYVEWRAVEELRKKATGQPQVLPQLAQVGDNGGD